MAVMLREKRYTPAEAAQICGVEPNSIWRWMTVGIRRCGKLKSFHIGGRRFIRESDLEEFLNRGNPEDEAEG